MKHLGDITKINGAEVPFVDCIIGGSPCQDLSIAGKRAGLAGERSGLFMEQIRIIKEMREASGETYPRFMCWENVLGAFSSNKGRDFAAVLEETIKIIEPEAPGIEVPEKGWSTWGGFRDMDGRWSVAWRVLDAQYWGVPQRRRRIALVADFGGCTAHEILFEREGVSRNFESSSEKGEGPAGTAETGFAYTVRIRGGCDGGGKGALIQKEKSGTLGTHNDQTVFCLQGNVIDRSDTAGCNGKGWREDKCYTLNTVDRPAVCYAFDSLASNSMKSKNPNSGCREVDIAKTLDTSDGNPSKNQGGICVLDISHRNDVIRYCGDKVPTLTARAGTGGNNVPLTLTGTDVVGTLMSRDYKGVGRADTFDRVIKEPCGRVRRLTPLECERLQGYPDGWTDIGEWTDSKGKKHKESSDSARYKALGNSIALPPWRFVLGEIYKQFDRPATMASLFDGIGGFPLIWQELGGETLWASEIEEFPIAVTKRHFQPAKTCAICKWYEAT